MRLVTLETGDTSSVAMLTSGEPCGQELLPWLALQTGTGLRSCTHEFVYLDLIGLSLWSLPTFPRGPSLCGGFK